MIIRELAAGDDVAAFSCGTPALDTWLQRNGLRNQGQFGVTRVVIVDGEIVGYFTVSATLIDSKIVGRTAPKQAPALLLGRMAVSQSKQRSGIGKVMLAKVFGLAVAQYATSGCAVIIVDAKPDAVAFYAKHQFQTIEADPTGAARMFIAMKTVMAAMPQDVIDELTKTG